MSKIPEAADTRQILLNRKAELEKALAGLNASTAPMEKERDELRAKMEPMEHRLNQLNNAIRKITQPHKGALELQLASLNKALSDKVMQALEATPANVEVILGGAA